MAYKSVEDSSLTAIANKIRSKTGSSSQLLFPSGFVSAIDSIINPSTDNLYKIVHGDIQYTSSSNRTFTVTVSGFTPTGALLVAVGGQSIRYVQSLSSSTNGTDNYGIATYPAGAKITTTGLNISGATVSVSNPTAGSTNLNIVGYYKYIIWGK